MTRMVSTHEMVAYLYNKALDKHDDAFVAHLVEMDCIGQITLITDEEILRLDTLYHQYRDRA